MKKVNRILSWIMVITMLIGLCPAWATGHPSVGERRNEEILRDLPLERQEHDVQTMELTENVSGYCGGEGDGTNLAWTLTTDGTLTISGTGEMAYYWLDMHNSNNSKYAPWYDYREYVTGLIIQDGVTSLSNYIFWGCYSLTSAVVPDSVTELGYGAFAFSGLKSIVIGDGVTEIKNNTFDSCTSLERVELGAGVVKMNFNRISSSIFYNCSSLKEIVVDQDCPLLSSIDGVLFDKAGETLLLYPVARAADTYTVPASVKTIKERAFEKCCALKNIVIPDTVETIEYGAFMNAALECASIGATTTARNAFYECSALKTVTFTSGAETIASAFSRSGLTEVTIPSSVKSLDEAFIYCESLKKAVVDCETIGGGAFSYCTSLTDLTIGENVRTIGSYAFCDTGLTELTIPGTVKFIESNAFWNCTALKELVIEDGVMSLGGTAFQDCTALEKATLPGSITDVGNSVFWNCTALEIVTLKNGFTTIGESMFWDCIALHTINIPDTLTTIDRHAFVNCTNISEIYIPLSVEYIGRYTFQDCINLKTVIYPGTEEQFMEIFIGDRNVPLWTAIGYEDPVKDSEGCNVSCPGFVLTTLDGETITKSYSDTMLIIFYRTTCGNSQRVVRELADSTITDTYDIEIIAVEIDGASENEIYSFASTYGNDGENIIFCKDGSIYADSFRVMSGNNGITLPFIYVLHEGMIIDYSSGYVTVADIEDMLPSDVSGAPDEPDEPSDPNEPEIPDLPEDAIASGTCGKSVYWYLTEDGTLNILGTGAMYDYAYSSPWLTYINSIDTVNISDGVTTIGKYAFSSLAVFTTVELPDTLRKIEDYAFDNCALTTIEIPDSVTTIGEYAFRSCIALKNVVFGKGVTIIGMGAFASCNAMESITLPDSVTNLGSYLFSGCTMLKNVTIPGSVPIIGEGAFEGCTALVSLEIPEGVTKIGNYAFSECTGLADIKLPSTLTLIDYSAFTNCTALESIVLPEGIEEIKTFTFDGCKKLASITIPVSVTYVDTDAFSGCISLKTVYYNGSESQWNKIYIATGNTRLSAADIVYGATDTEPELPVLSGTCGENLTWELADGVLTIRGEGEMKSDDWYTPWFDYSYDVVRIVIEEGVTSIEPLAFQCFIYLTEVSLPSSLTSIGYFAFVDCTALAEINFPDGLKSIGYSAFEKCNSLVSVSLPDSVTTMGSRVFAECADLAYIKLPAGIKEIPTEALIACTALATITIPENVTTIGNYAFLDCKNLTSVTIGKNVTKIGFQTFDRCTSLATVYYAGTEEQWNAINISNYNDPLKNAKIFYESTHVHTSEIIPGSPATCTETGLTEGEKCSECGNILIEQQVIPALGHDYDDGTVEVKSSCEAGGLVRYTCMREGCNDSYTKETAAHGHKEEKIPAKQPTMTETGLTPGVKCAICDKILVAQEEVAPVAPEATDIISETILGELQSGMNRETLYYSIGSPARWDNPIGSYLFENADGTISVLRSWTLDDEGEGLRVYTYSKSLELLDTKYIPWELPLFGGFYAGEEYNYIVFGQENWEEDDTKEVIRLVKYDKDFNRVGSIAVCDAYTCVPFDAGSLRMAENGNELIVHTSRTRYLTVDDGLHHQSQLTIYFDTESMTVTADNLGAFQGNHVGHSFNQFVIYDGDAAVLLDHGDAYPRSIVLNKEKSKQRYTAHDLLWIPGPEGANCTGVSIGDFTQSETSYLAAINTIDHSLATGYDSFDIFFVDGVEYEERDAVLLVVDKETLKTEQVYLTDYVGTGKTVSAPRLVALGQGRFLAVWSVFTLEPSEHIYYEPSEYGVSFVVVDGNGNRLTPIMHQPDAHLLDGQPIVWNGAVTWFVDNTVDIFDSNATRILYQIDLSDLLGDAAHTPEVIPGYDPTCTEPGKTDGKKCADCGKILVEQQEIPALGHDFDEGVVTKEPTCTEKGEKTCICRRCGEQCTEEIPTVDHTEEAIPGKEPTLTEPGLTAGKKCANCGQILLEQEKIPVLESVSGTCGEALAWTLTKEGVLTISGEGAMFDFKAVEPLQLQSVVPMSEGSLEAAPWSDYTDLIVKVVIEDGVTSIGDNAFADCEKLAEVKIPETVTEIGDDVFSGCEALETVTYSGSEEQWSEIEIGAGNEVVEEKVVISSVKKGDVNGDGKVNGRDTIMIATAIANKTTQEFTADQFAAADVNGDGKINGRDTIQIATAIANKTTDEL